MRESRTETVLWFLEATMKRMDCRRAFSLFMLLWLSSSVKAHAYDLFGSDIAGLDVANPDQCASACSSNSNCLAWTFVLPGTPRAAPGPSPRCYLKNPVPSPTANNCCLSGLKRSDNWCGENTQGLVLTCPSGLNCGSKRTRTCEGWWIFRTCTTLVTTDYFCQ